MRRGCRVTAFGEHAVDAPPNTGQRISMHTSDDRSMLHVPTLNASTQQAFISITYCFESPVDPLRLDNSNVGWYHLLHLVHTCKATTYLLGTAKRYVARLMTATASGRPYGLASYCQRGHSQRQTMSLASANTFSPCLCNLPRCQGHCASGRGIASGKCRLPTDAGA